MDGSFAGFWERVLIGGANDCWPWVGGSLDKDGYGRFQAGKRTRRYRAHRVAHWLFHHDASIAERVVMHSCDNPICCNPAHLSLGTQGDNLRDMHAKRRHPGTKLDMERARAIRADRRTHSVIAKEYGISPALVCVVKQQKLWADAPLIPDYSVKPSLSFSYVPPPCDVEPTADERDAVADRCIYHSADCKVC